MGLWARLSVTAVASLVAGAGLWAALDAVGADPGIAGGAAAGLVTVVVTLGAVWASQARESIAPTAEGGALVSGSPSGQAVGQAHAPVFGPGSDFTGATFTFHPPPPRGPPAPENAATMIPGRAVAPAPGGRRVVVGEIPQEPPAFQDRAELLDALTGPAAGGRVRVVFAVTGLRGVGKSQLAAACARQRLAEGWRVVAWLDASDREQLLAGYAQLAAELGLAGDGPDSADAAARVRHWLETGGEQCLIVLDNADSAGLLRPLLPVAGHAQVIVTSSRTPLAALGSPVPVDVFTEPEAAAFLAERTGLSDDGALEVARELGGLPLALAQAAAVIAGQRLSYSSYLQRLAGVTVADSLPAPEEDPYPRGTAEAITLALNAAQAADPPGLGRRLLEVSALLSPAGTSRTLLAEAVNRDPAEVNPTLQHLGAWSLVTRSVDGTTVTAHRLVMRVTREQADASHTLAEAARHAIRGLNTMLPAAEDAGRHPVLMQEFVTQVTALAGYLDTFPGLLDG